MRPGSAVVVVVVAVAGIGGRSRIARACTVSVTTATVSGPGGSHAGRGKDAGLSFDVLWGQSAWVHIADKSSFIRRWSRALKTGDRIALEDAFLGLQVVMIVAIDAPLHLEREFFSENPQQKPQTFVLII